ncbi:12099_t:CDS:2 [Acaulospora colombiana]|uniref:12099_t:CDS:1 n=1 Tax=Acaulospora colombiana TaxID=27376 RepID=A0ACA9MES3_9GLOM|nr:12099_t:CDS:2 [Acaulospora colombiana]
MSLFHDSSRGSPRVACHAQSSSSVSHSFTSCEPSVTRYSTSYQVPRTDKMQWILFQVGIFADEVLRNDISAVTTAFHNPKQFIFINISVKSDLAQIIAHVAVSKKVELNRNYVVGEFVSHTFLEHIYKVLNHGHDYDSKLPCGISEFEMNNSLRLSGTISSRLIPRIIYPDCSFSIWKLCTEISLQHEATIYKSIVDDHKQVTLRDWVLQTINKKHKKTDIN